MGFQLALILHFVESTRVTGMAIIFFLFGAGWVDMDLGRINDNHMIFKNHTGCVIRAMFAD
jgi:hypothetical protein